MGRYIPITCKRGVLSTCECWVCDRDSLTVAAIYRMMRQGKINSTRTAKDLARKKLSFNIDGAIEIWARRLLQ